MWKSPKPDTDNRFMNTLHFDKFWAWFFAVLWWPFWKWRLVEILRCWESIQNIIIYLHTNFIPPLYEKSGGYIAITLSVRPSVCPSVHTFVTLRYLSFYWKKWFYIWYMALAWWFVPCLPFPGLQHIYFLFTVWLTNERVGVFLARRSVQHLVLSAAYRWREEDPFHFWRFSLLPLLDLIWRKIGFLPYFFFGLSFNIVYTLEK